MQNPLGARGDAAAQIGDCACLFTLQSNHAARIALQAVRRADAIALHICRGNGASAAMGLLKEPLSVPGSRYIECYGKHGKAYAHTPPRRSDLELVLTNEQR